MRNDATGSNISSKRYTAYQYCPVRILARPAIYVRTWTLNEGIKVCWLCVRGDRNQLDLVGGCIVTYGHRDGLNNGECVSETGNEFVRSFPSRRHLTVHFEMPMA
jgi:hypothetical protein